jgi:hypothetical protein
LLCSDHLTKFWFFTMLIRRCLAHLCLALEVSWVSERTRNESLTLLSGCPTLMCIIMEYLDKRVSTFQVNDLAVLPKSSRQPASCK